MTKKVREFLNEQRMLAKKAKKGSEYAKEKLRQDFGIKSWWVIENNKKAVIV